MWPFKRGSDTDESDALRESDRQARERLQEFRQIGEKFVYLGVEMCVTGHVKLELNWGWPHIGSSRYYRTRPVLRADYATKMGEIKQISFDPGEVDRLLKPENPPLQKKCWDIDVLQR